MKKRLFLIAASMVLLAMATLTGYAHNHEHEKVKANTINLYDAATIIEKADEHGDVIARMETHDGHRHSELSTFDNLNVEKVSSKTAKPASSANAMLIGLLFFDVEAGGCPGCNCLNAHLQMCDPGGGGGCSKHDMYDCYWN